MGTLFNQKPRPDTKDEQLAGFGELIKDHTAAIREGNEND